MGFGLIIALFILWALSQGRFADYAQLVGPMLAAKATTQSA